MAQNWGLLNDMASGMKEAMTIYQTKQNNERQERQFNLVNGIQGFDETNKPIFTPEEQQKRDIQAQELKQKAANFDPTSDASQAARGLLKQTGVNVPDNLTGAQAEKYQPLLDTKIRADASRDTSETRAHAKLTPKDKDWVTFGNDIDPNRSRSGNLGKTQAMINSAGRVDALFKQFPDYNIPATQTHELAAAISGLINGGSAQSQSQIDSMVPSSMAGNAEKMASWLTNSPRGLEQRKFMEMMHETARREGDVAQKQKTAAIVSKLPTYYNLLQADQGRFRRMIRGQGIDPATLDEDLMLKAQPEAPAGLLGQSQTNSAPNPLIKEVNGVKYQKAEGGWKRVK